ncbi:transcriptional regulator [Niveomyces insectorum RCEF 264]|uniref:Transcriptional regulator n=1 Tax=Niveomyces insectorum RCEF 264 TaxID=1081102 RepID=A0A167VBL0_9HYPO|nr:transcriptional regulator [Niveomyces insectorum RCEF 264]
MAGSDPRRSSRARTSQPQSRPSSTTSSVSGRLDRNAFSSSSSSRPFAKTGSPQKTASTSTASTASEPPDDAAANTADDTPPPPTRSRRATTQTATLLKDDDQDLSSVVVSEIEMLNDGDDVQEDDEAVRCICGYDDYPGPPGPEDLKQAAKDGYDVDAIFPTVITDDLAGFFVQCDICKVWQHGACVGLVNDSTLPEEYYCEECKKDFHRIFPGTNGPRWSIYRALDHHRSRTSSFVKDRDRSPKTKQSSREQSKEQNKDKDASNDALRDTSKEPRPARPASISQTSKRRSTMNSRDAAYDEEQLRIAIEASKGEVSADSADAGSRRPKRSRSDSEEKSDGIKRQRTSSRSASPTGEAFNPADDSDDAMATRNGSSRKAARSAAAAVRLQQQRERAEKEEKERQRAEAANKRNGRAERRRADGTEPTRATIFVRESEAHSDTDSSDPSDEVPLSARAAGRSLSSIPTTATTATAAASTTTTMTATTTNNNTTATTTTTTTTAIKNIDANSATVAAADTLGTAAANAPASSAPSTSSAAQRTGPARPTQPSPETPPPTSAPAMSVSKSAKGGRPTHRKKGRNQYTKERDLREEQNANQSRSRDGADGSQGKSGSGGGSGSGQNSSKSGSRSKGGNANSRISMTEMRRRVGAMSDFIGKTQVEIAGGEYLASAVATPDSGTQPPGKGSNVSVAAAANGGSDATTPSSAVPRAAVNGDKGAQSPTKRASESAGDSASGNAGAGAGAPATIRTGSSAPEKEFKQLPLLEMMDILTRNIIHWQSQYGGG